MGALPHDCGPAPGMPIEPIDQDGLESACPSCGRIWVARSEDVGDGAAVDSWWEPAEDDCDD